MSSKAIRFFSLFLLVLVFYSGISCAQKKEPGQPIRISLQKRIPSDSVKGVIKIVNEIQQWDSKQTAIIICDMWRTSIGAKVLTARVAEMAPYLNKVISIAREKGVLIVHAPSDCMKYYKDYPGRKMAQKYTSRKAASMINDSDLPSEKNTVWPIDQSDGGCDDSPTCQQGNPWSHEIDLIKIEDKDAISDNGAEIGGLFYKRGIRNVILMGVHTNMCVIGRSFGLRNMVRLAMNVVLMRDLTDVMYDSRQSPYVSHFTGISLIEEHIESFVCPTIVSTDFTGEKQFRFQNDKRPVVAFIIAENEYHANESLPAFAHELLLKKGVNCEFALGKPVYEGEGIHNIENLQIMKDADLAIIQVRRRALPSEQMNLIKEYVKTGKPILGLRTASHAFNANQVVPNTGGRVVGCQRKSF